MVFRFWNLAENVDAAEDRELFDGILEECQIPRPKGDTVYTAEQAKEVANRLLSGTGKTFLCIRRSGYADCNQ